MIVPNGMSRLKSTTGSLTSSAYQPVCLGHGTNHAAVHERNVLQVLVRDGHRSDGDLGFLAQNFHSHVGHQRSLHQLTVSAGSLFLSSTSVGATTLTASDALVDIRWQQVHLDTATIDIRRAKNGTPGIHGLQGDELRLLRALRREHPRRLRVLVRAEGPSIRGRRAEAYRTAWRGRSTFTLCYRSRALREAEQRTWGPNPANSAAFCWKLIEHRRPS